MFTFNIREIIETSIHEGKETNLPCRRTPPMYRDTPTSRRWSPS
jgi:hypothetical protein